MTFVVVLPSEEASFLWLWNRPIKICIRQWFHCTFEKKKTFGFSILPEGWSSTKILATLVNRNEKNRKCACAVSNLEPELHNVV